MGSQAPMAGDWESARTGDAAATTRSSTPMSSARLRQGLWSQDIDSPLGPPVSYAAPESLRGGAFGPVEAYKLPPRGATKQGRRRSNARRPVHVARLATTGHDDREVGARELSPVPDATFSRVYRVCAPGHSSSDRSATCILTSLRSATSCSQGAVAAAPSLF